MNWKQLVSLGLCSVGAYAQNDDSEWVVYGSGTTETETLDSGFVRHCFDITTVVNKLQNKKIYEVWVNGEKVATYIDGLTMLFVVASWLGNKQLANNGSDTGEDFCIYQYSADTLDSVSVCTAYFRNPGTYTIGVKEIPFTGDYKYNGVVLPDLPDYSEAIYPYTVIVSDGQEYHFCCKYSPYTTLADGSVDLTNTQTAMKYVCRNGAWEKNEGIDFTATGVWANHNVIGADGSTVVLAKSDPVPVFT